MYQPVKFQRNRAKRCKVIDDFGGSFIIFGVEGDTPTLSSQTKLHQICYNFHCSYIAYCIVICEHISGQYWPFAFIPNKYTAIICAFNALLIFRYVFYFLNEEASKATVVETQCQILVFFTPAE